MDKVLEEFEEWFKRDYHPDKTGPYMKDALLYAWKASRAALCVELPDGSYCGFEGDSFHAYMCGVESCKDILDEAGVSYK